MKRRKLLSLAGLSLISSSLVARLELAIQTASIVLTQQSVLAEEEPMQLLKEFRLFADHYQFLVYDAEADPLPESFYSDLDDERSDIGSYRQGYITNGRTICFGTVAHLNDHWIEVYASSQIPDFDQAERVIALPLNIDSGRVGITDLLYLNEPSEEILVDPGVWTIYFLAFNLGSDRLWERRVARPERRSERLSDELSDEQLRTNWEFERYRIVLVPGFQPPIGIIHGEATIEAAIMAFHPNAQQLPEEE